MDVKVITRAVFIVLSTVGTCWAGCCVKSSEPKRHEVVKPDSVEKVLKQLKQKTETLESYQARIEYLFKQPLFESQSLRKGVLYYQKFGEKSKLKMNFKTLKQDDEKQQKYIEQFIFDGVWLTKIDYQLRQVTRRQLAEPNEPVDAFELAKRNFPIIGFSKTEELKKEFEIKLIERKRKEHPHVIPAKAGIQESIQLHLKVKPDSTYKDDYTSIDFWVDTDSNLPAKIVAVTTEDDVYEIKLLDAKVNKKLYEKIFELKIPQGFGKEIIPLKKKAKLSLRGPQSPFCHCEACEAGRGNLIRYTKKNRMMQTKQFYVYIMTNKADTVLYTGMTNDIRKRVYEHKQKLVDGFTKKYNVAKLVYYEVFGDCDSAIQREKQIKAGSRRKKEELINGVNRERRDLYEEL
jgi:putative endonuclease